MATALSSTSDRKRCQNVTMANKSYIPRPISIPINPRNLPEFYQNGPQDRAREICKKGKPVHPNSSALASQIPETLYTLTCTTLLRSLARPSEASRPPEGQPKVFKWTRKMPQLGSETPREGPQKPEEGRQGPQKKPREGAQRPPKTRIKKRTTKKQT